MTQIPLPEHPRPDKQRAQWLNLNGHWHFRFDHDDCGREQQWFTRPDAHFDRQILVPFGWGSELSGQPDEAPVAWYRRPLDIPKEWQGQRIFLIVGASDWQTDAWLGGNHLGVNRGGYTPFEFELTHLVDWEGDNTLTLRVDDRRRDFALFGKQGYGDVHGLWQTVYLEARPQQYLDTVHFIPDIDRHLVTVKATLDTPAKQPLDFAVQFASHDRAADATATFKPGQHSLQFDITFDKPHLWNIDDPYLYDVTCTLRGHQVSDALETYFGLRSITVEPMPGTGHPYIALNHQPVYLQLTLDQSYHPQGFYTFPSDEFMRNEILLSKQLGLTGNRIHIKVEVPRKLYWADRLGLLIMADVPNSWGQPTQEMFAESEHCLRDMLKRDMNHPSIFTWVIYNETWGLFTNWNNPDGSKQRKYLPQTQNTVAQMVALAKELDPSRLVEDNSPCNNDHVVTDINSWHSYLPGYKWEEACYHAEARTFPGSTWNFIDGHVQGHQPMLNSECGNVWGYKGSTGDIDWSWDYHLMLDAFHRHPKIAGWLYTEHHDVINEWNGYVRSDRSPKFTGIEELFPGMTLQDWHRDAYLALDPELCRTFKPGETWELPLHLSLTTSRYDNHVLELTASMRYWNDRGELIELPLSGCTRTIRATSWQNQQLATFNVKLPDVRCAGTVCLTLRDQDEHQCVVARNFTCFVVKEQPAPTCETTADGQTILRIRPQDFSRQQWSLKQWNVLENAKVNGAGSGFFEYSVQLPTSLQGKTLTLIAELGAKQLFGKDQDSVDQGALELNCMLGGGHHDPSKNANAYPMTDTLTFSSDVTISANGSPVAVITLPDDPADHRGFLSWNAQLRNHQLCEAGSYGYLVTATIPADVLADSDTLTLRFQAQDHGLAIYGEDAGRFPLNITVLEA